LGNAEELLDSLLELRADGHDLRTMIVFMKQDDGWATWSGEVDVNQGDISLWKD
jgi:hypothetical protein